MSDGVVRTASLPQVRGVAAGRGLASVLVLAFGLLLIYGAAFSPMAALHDTAHDSRHGLSFPCH